MKELYIKLLGDFKMIQSGTDVIRVLAGSKKKIALLEYLILQRHRAVPVAELFDTIWPLEDNSNPENALKTLISRLRKDLSVYGLSELIATKAGAYMWNAEFPCSIDLYEFEALCEQAVSRERADDETRALFKRILQLYGGDLMENSGNESWVVSRSVYYHNLYLKAVYRYIELLRADGDNEEICGVCRAALEIDAFDSVISLELIAALTALGKKREAAAQYEYASDLQYGRPGERTDEELRELYGRILTDRRDAESAIEDILRDLSTGDETQGAFVCDYAIFKDIYHLNMRNLQRLNIPIFIVLATVSCIDGRPVEPLMLHKLMNELLETMCVHMRRGDTISRYGPNQFAILLPAVNYDTGRLVMERVKRQFYQKDLHSRFVFNYRLTPIENE